MSTVIKMECDDCSKGKYVEKETISHIREKVSLQEVHTMRRARSQMKTEFLLKVEFRHSEEAALSALFNEFGSARFQNLFCKSKIIS